MKRNAILLLMIVLSSCSKEATTTSARSTSTTIVNNEAITSTYRYSIPFDYINYNECTEPHAATHITGAIDYTIHGTFIGNRINYVIEQNGDGITATDVATGTVSNVIIHNVSTASAVWSEELKTYVSEASNLNVKFIYISPMGASILVTVKLHIVTSADGSFKMYGYTYSYDCK